MVKTKFKQTEIGLIPEDWEVAELLNITTLMTNGFVGVAKIHYSEALNSVLYIQGYNVGENSFNYSGIKRISREFHNKHPRSSLKHRDLLTIQTGDVGLTAYVPKELEGANCHALIISRFKEDVTSSKYASYYINSHRGRSRLRLIETGTTMKHINVGDFQYFQIPLPPLPEQIRIAQTLSDTDAWIESLEKLIDKKRLIKQGAMQELLTPKEDWGDLMLGEVANITRGASPRPIDSPIWFDEKSTIGWVRISDVTKSNKFLNTTTQKLSALGVKNSRYVENDSLIMSICATVGKPIITQIDVCIHDGFVVFSDLKLEKDYLYNYLKFIEKDWAKNGQTGSQMNLNTTLINTTQVYFPKSGIEQTRIAAILSDMDLEIETLENKLHKARQLKQGMMQELLTGRIRLVESIEVEKIRSTPAKGHNDQFNDAVLIATMASVFGSDNFPLTRFKYTKVSYLLKRYKEEQDAGYLKHAAGPYKPKTRYGGAEKIAINKKYIDVVATNYKGKEYEGFVASENVDEAIKYFDDWYGTDALKWIEQYKFEKNDNLELWATVDMAVEDLKQKNEPVTVETIKQILKDNKEWKDKLKRSTFSDINIQKAVIKLETLFT